MVTLYKYFLIIIIIIIIIIIVIIIIIIIVITLIAKCEHPKVKICLALFQLACVADEI